MLRRLAVLAVLGGAAGAYLAWPRLNVVETGRTPEYPDLQDRTYAAGEDRVAEAARKVLGRLPGWNVVGGGRGPGGYAIEAVHDVFGFADEVTVRIRRDGGKTRVTVRSKSRTGPVDFGQNARNVRELLSALDHEVS
jgi:uncharacterized protein (DUF1499 family)